MALGTLTLGGQQGQAPLRPSFVRRMQFPGDSAYPTGGTLNFSDYLAAELGHNPTIVEVHGYGYSGAGALTHFVRYIESTDALQVHALAGTQVANNADLSTTTFDVTVVYR